MLPNGFFLRQSKKKVISVHQLVLGAKIITDGATVVAYNAHATLQTGDKILELIAPTTSPIAPKASQFISVFLIFE